MGLALIGCGVAATPSISPRRRALEECWHKTVAERARCARNAHAATPFSLRAGRVFCASACAVGWREKYGCQSTWPIWRRRQTTQSNQQKALCCSSLSLSTCAAGSLRGLNCQFLSPRLHRLFSNVLLAARARPNPLISPLENYRLITYVLFLDAVQGGQLQLFCHRLLYLYLAHFFVSPNWTEYTIFNKIHTTSISPIST